MERNEAKAKETPIKLEIMRILIVKLFIRISFSTFLSNFLILIWFFGWISILKIFGFFFASVWNVREVYKLVWVHTIFNFDFEEIHSDYT